MLYTHIIKYYLAIKNNEVVIHAKTQMNLNNTHILHDSISMKCAEEENPQRQGIDECCQCLEAEESG